MTGDRMARSIADEAGALEIAGISDRGPVRTQNQDVWDAQVAPEGTTAVLALADGMGGHKGGLESAEAAVLGAMSVLTGAGPEADPPDSRAYLIRDTAVTQLTDDHSWAAGQVRAGALDAAEARHHPKRNLIERAVMGDPVDADVFELDARAGDVLLLCSDGLWEPLADSALGAVIASPDALGVALTRACDAALAGGGTDNVTMVAARWLPSPSATV
jgi:serine/threonine protein phosphatase PrpC